MAATHRARARAAAAAAAGARAAGAAPARGSAPRPPAPPGPRRGPTRTCRRACSSPSLRDKYNPIQSCFKFYMFVFLTVHLYK